MKLIEFIKGLFAKKTIVKEPIPEPKALFKIGKTTILELHNGDIQWTSGMTVCGDGSPRCYHPDSGKGLDYLANAGNPGNWFGIITKANGDPYVQGKDAPAHSDKTVGFYVSCTAGIADKSRKLNDPRRYHNAEEIPYIVIPLKFPIKGLMGKTATVTNTNNGQSCTAIVGELGPVNKIGEGSIALAEALGINSSCRKGGIAGGITYTIHI